MRFSANIYFKNQKIQLPLTYRKNFISLIKEAIKQENKELFDKFYGQKTQNTQKPFTFSIYLPDFEKVNQYLILKSQNLKFNFTSNDYNTFISLYNGLLKLKNYRLFGHDITIRQFNFKKEPEFENKAIFKTYSPILIRNTKNRKGVGFLFTEDKNFQEQLKYSIINQSNYFLKSNLNITDINFTFLKMKSDIVHLYGGEKGNSGIFMLEAPESIIKLVYDTGIGAKRSQGFGMLEIVR